MSIKLNPKKKKIERKKINKLETKKKRKKKALHILQHYLEDEEAWKENHASLEVKTF